MVKIAFARIFHFDCIENIPPLYRVAWHLIKRTVICGNKEICKDIPF